MQAHLLLEPWEVETGQGGFYRVFSPFWRAVRDRVVAAPAVAPSRRGGTGRLARQRAAGGLAPGRGDEPGGGGGGRYQAVGEAAARAGWRRFWTGRCEDYAAARDLPGVAGTSRLSENLTYGEIGIRDGLACRAAGAWMTGRAGAETFLKELVWREFAYHLMHHTPQITPQNWRRSGTPFPGAATTPEAERWRRGMTGEPFVDAAMREMYVTGTMHNRARMIVAST